MSATCIILDCDGVLVDSELISARVAAACFASADAVISMEEVLLRFTGMKATEVTAAIFGERGLAVPARATEARLEATMAAFESELRPMPGADEALSAIRALKCVASSSHHDRIALALRVTGLARHFGDAVFSSTMVERGKPAPDLFRHAAKAMGWSRRTASWSRIPSPASPPGRRRACRSSASPAAAIAGLTTATSWWQRAPTA